MLLGAMCIAQPLLFGKISHEFAKEWCWVDNADFGPNVAVVTAATAVVSTATVVGRVALMGSAPTDFLSWCSSWSSTLVGKGHGLGQSHAVPCCAANCAVGGGGAIGDPAAV